MSYAAATFPDVTLFDGRIFAPGAGRRLLDGAIIGLGIAAAACALAATATVAAAWIIGTALSSNPSLHAKASIGLGTIGAPNQRLTLAGTVDFSGSVHLTDHDYALDLTRDAELARAALLSSVPTTTPLAVTRPLEAANDVPLQPHLLSSPDQAAKHDAADVPDLTHVAGLAPAAAPSSAPTSAAPLPLKQTSGDAKKVPMPQPRPLAGPHIKAKDETNRSPVSQAAPQIAAVVPPPPAQLTPSQTPGNSNLPPAADSRTAVYDIQAHTVYLPNGDRLEAHSGLGWRRDDPHYVSEKNRGPTPPNVYELALRRKRFHGVQAIRLNPVDDRNMFGRDGMLAHTYMLGPSGQSFGCVSFKDYPAFLRAYLDGEVERLVVVPHLASAPVRTASAGRGHADRYALNGQ